MKEIKENKRFTLDKPFSKDSKYYIKRILLPFFDLFYRFIACINRPKNTQPKKYTLSICAIFKDEGLSLKEWIEFHKIVGVEHFYMYNNFSTDNYAEILAPYVEKGEVSLIEWPVEKGQFPAYYHFLDNLKHETQWVSFLDLDEYICPNRSTDIREWLGQYKQAPAVLLYWKIFGTSGRIEHDNSKLITEQYTICSDKFSDIGKYLLNTDWTVHRASFSMHQVFVEAHFLSRKIVVPPINEFYRYCRWNIQRVPCGKTMSIQVNHYITKSYKQTVINKFQRGDAVFGNDKQTRTVGIFLINEHWCTSVDYTIFRFMIELKLALGKDKAND